MRQLRRPASQITPDYEDSGLFKSDLCVRHFDLVPIVRQTGRADVEVTSVTPDGQVVPVLFAGRRRGQAAHVIALLEHLRAHLASPSVAGSPGRLRQAGASLQVEVEGAWRRLCRTDADGFLHRSYQFVAACWTLTLGDGQRVRFGSPPAVAISVAQ